MEVKGNGVLSVVWAESQFSAACIPLGSRQLGGQSGDLVETGSQGLQGLVLVG